MAILDDRRHATITKIERITATRIITEGGTRFRRRDLRRVGVNAWESSELANPADERVRIQSNGQQIVGSERGRDLPVVGQTATPEQWAQALGASEVLNRAAERLDLQAEVAGKLGSGATVPAQAAAAIADWMRSAAVDAQQIGPEPLAVKAAEAILGGSRG